MKKSIVLAIFGLAFATSAFAQGIETRYYVNNHDIIRATTYVKQLPKEQREKGEYLLSLAENERQMEQGAGPDRNASVSYFNQVVKLLHDNGLASDMKMAGTP
jgi:hypothetical protein